jgi:hypothetical protein
MNIVYPTTTEVTGEGPTTLDGANIARVYNSSGSDVLITVAAPGSGGAVVGTMTVKAGDTVLIGKGPTDVIESSGTVKITGCLT